MTIRIDTTLETGTTDPWTPQADTIIQGAVVANSGAVIEVQGRLDALAPWVALNAIRPASEGMMLVRKLAELRLSWSGNAPGAALKAWSGE